MMAPMLALSKSNGKKMVENGRIFFFSIINDVFTFIDSL